MPRLWFVSCQAETSDACFQESSADLPGLSAHRKDGGYHTSALGKGVGIWNCDIVEKHKINKQEEFGRFCFVACSQTTLCFFLFSIQFQPVSRSSSETGGGKWQEISQGWTVVHPQEFVSQLRPPGGIMFCRNCKGKSWSCSCRVVQQNALGLASVQRKHFK